MKTAILKHKQANGEFFEYTLSQQVYTLGRSTANSIAIQEPGISRLHFRIENRQGDFYITDNNSSNGTFVNKLRIHTEQKLVHGDTIMAGKVELSFFIKPDLSPEGAMLNETAQVERPAQFLATEKATDPGGIRAELRSTIPDLGPPPLPEAPPPSPIEEIALEKNAPPPIDLPPPPKIEAPPRVAPPPMATGDDQMEASAVQRLVAFLIDCGVNFALMVPSILFWFFGGYLLSTVLLMLGTLAILAHWVAGWHYHGKTMGKHLMGIKIIELDTPNKKGLSPKAVLLRIAGYMLCGILMNLPFLSILFDDEGRGIHDKIAGTKVVRAN